MRPAVSTIQELSCVYGSITTRSKWNVVTHSLNDRDDPSKGFREMFGSGEIVTDIKLAHKAFCCGTIRTLGQRYFQVFRTMIPWCKEALEYFEVDKEISR